MSLLHLLFQIKGKGGRFSALKEIPEEFQAAGCVQFPGNGGKLGEMSKNVGSQPEKIGPGFVNVLLVDTDRQIPLLDDAVADTGNLGQQHFIVLVPVTIQPVPLYGKQEGTLKVPLVDPAVVDGDLGANTGVQGIEEFRVIQKHVCFVLFACNPVIDVGKGKALGKAVSHLKNPIRPDAADGNGLLY